MYDLVLTAHVVGAILGIFMTALALLDASFFRRGRARIRISVFLMSAAFQIGSGTVLAILSETITARSICDNLFVYMAIYMCAIGLFKTHQQVKEESLAFSCGAVGVSILAFATTFAFGA